MMRRSRRSSRHSAPSRPMPSNRPNSLRSDMAAMLQSDIMSLPFLHRGKVRDIYAVGEDRLLVIQTDRLSAFDVILDDPIPGKGEVLTAMSEFWFKKLAHVIPTHIT